MYKTVSQVPSAASTADASLCTPINWAKVDDEKVVTRQTSDGGDSGMDV